MGWGLLLALALCAWPAVGDELGYRCPASVIDDRGRSATLADANQGVWRVDEAIPFLGGEGRFWRYVCRYGDGGDAVEAVVHWVEIPRDDDRPLLDGACGASQPPGMQASNGLQATVEARPAGSTAGERLAADMLRAAEAIAIACPGEDANRDLCKRWDVVETRPDGSEVTCVWNNPRPPGTTESGRWEYDGQCRFRVFNFQGTVRRMGRRRYLRETVDGSGRSYRVTYVGDFELLDGEVLEVDGEAHWVRSSGSSGAGIQFQARCVEP